MNMNVQNEQINDLHKGYALIKQVLDAFCPKGKSLKLIPKCIGAPACTDTESEIYINPQLICGLSDPLRRRRAIGLILHELGHCFYTKTDDPNHQRLIKVYEELRNALPLEEQMAVLNKLSQDINLFRNCLEDPRIEHLMTFHGSNVHQILEKTQSDFTNPTDMKKVDYENRTLLNLLGFYIFYKLNEKSYIGINYSKILTPLSKEIKQRGVNIRILHTHINNLFDRREHDCNVYNNTVDNVIFYFLAEIVDDYKKRAKSITDEAQSQESEEDQNDSDSQSSNEECENEKSSSSSKSKGEKGDESESGSNAQSSEDNADGQEDSDSKEQEQENDDKKSGSNSGSNTSKKSTSGKIRADNSPEKTENSNSSNISTLSQEIEKLEATTSSSLQEEFEKLCQRNKVQVIKRIFSTKKKGKNNLSEEIVKKAKFDYREPQERQEDRFHSKEEWEHIFETYAKTSNSLVAKVKRELLAYTRKAPVSFGKKGKKLANTKIAKVAQGIYTKNPFVAKGNSECLDTHISVMFDCSGSMHVIDRRISLEKSAALLASTLGRCESENLIASMFTYSDHNYQVKKPMQRVTAKTFADSYIAEWCGTSGWQCIVRAYQEMMQYNKTRKVLVVVTDGVWDSDPKTTDLYKILRDSNIELYGIMIGDSVFRNTPEWNASFRAEDPEQLDEIMQELFVQVLHQNKQQLKKLAS